MSRIKEINREDNERLFKDNINLKRDNKKLNDLLYDAREDLKEKDREINCLKDKINNQLYNVVKVLDLDYESTKKLINGMYGLDTLKNL